MENRHRGKTRSKVDVALEDSFPASDPAARNMGRDAAQPARPAASPGPQTKRPPRRGAGAKRRVARADLREGAKAREQQMQGRTLPGGRLLLSPVAWLRWLLRRTVRPAERQF